MRSVILGFQAGFDNFRVIVEAEDFFKKVF
jgi:hypothetical protein